MISDRLRELVLLSLLLPGVPVSAGDFYIAADAAPDGDGSQQRPWRLEKALEQPPAVQPGDTLWLRGGVYRGGFVSKLKGTEARPITVRPAAGEEVVIDCKPRDAKDSGLFSIDGDSTIVRDLEFTCSDPKRRTEIKGSWPEDIRRGGVSSRGSHNKLINLVVHDTHGIGFWGTDESGEGGEVSGCIIYHNGWVGPDRGHGHAIYAQNGLGTKRIADNIMFNQFGQGLHCYGSEKARLSGFNVTGNVAFNNGALVKEGHRDGGILLGGSTPLERTTVSVNFAYNNGFQLGYSRDIANSRVTVRNNYIAGTGVRFVSLPDLTFIGNRIIAPGSLMFLEMGKLDRWPCHWDSNSYIRTKTEYAPFHLTDPGGKGAGLTFDQWRQRTGFDSTSTYQEAPPPESFAVAVRNQHEAGRAHIIVFNWDRDDRVEVDLNNILKEGQRFTIHSVQNLKGQPVFAGVYDGRPVQLPMKPCGHQQPVGMADYALPVTEPEFGVYLVRAMPREA